MSTSTNMPSSPPSPSSASTSALRRARSLSGSSTPCVGLARMSCTMGMNRNTNTADSAADEKKSPQIAIGTFRLKLGDKGVTNEGGDNSETSGSTADSTTIEIELPSLFVGMWQLSSNAWGTAPLARVRKEIERHMTRGFIAFADHYGSSELIFGKVRSGLPDPSSVFGATKYCVFRNIEPTREVIEAAVHERLSRMRTEKVDLLQFHWQDYSNKGYLEALRHLHDMTGEGPYQGPKEGKLIRALGLCNFDSKRTDEICTFLGPGAIVTNQVQFSLIDTRPLHCMAHVCSKHNVKLLTYGTLCGGFLSDRWLGKSEPTSYDSSLTPSQRKYLDMILRAWGTWDLFQELLQTLRAIADRHNASISSENRTDNNDNDNGGGGASSDPSKPECASIANIATRWVLDHAFVGAVLIGTRLGLSSHIEDNLRVFDPTFFPALAFNNADSESDAKSKSEEEEVAAGAAVAVAAARSHSCAGRGLTDEDRARIEVVLKRSNASKLVATIGDCGAEYRLGAGAEAGGVEMA